KMQYLARFFFLICVIHSCPPEYRRQLKICKNDTSCAIYIPKFQWRCIGNNMSCLALYNENDFEKCMRACENSVNCAAFTITKHSSSQISPLYSCIVIGNNIAKRPDSSSVCYLRS
uniref:Apple domain-containing protein n=1 Tax=Parascaris univalens TaxID=6257 RepID=A0A915B5W1_PARUN